MNLILNKTRNSWGADNVDRFIFIYMNERTLNRPVDAKELLRYTIGMEMDTWTAKGQIEGVICSGVKEMMGFAI